MKEKMSMREAYGRALCDLGADHPEVVVLDCDVAHSTKTVYFGQAYPERYFNFGIQEANAVDAAAGLAAVGLVPFVNTFAFLAALRTAEQIRTSIAYNNLNVKIVGSYGGLSDSYDGASHQSVFDLAVLRSMPHMTVVVPSDGSEMSGVLRELLRWEGPAYLRLCRNEVPVLMGKDREFRMGKVDLLREGEDMTFLVTGILLDRTLQAADELSREGIECRVLRLATLKPVDEEAVVRAAEETGALVTVEEHSIIGGLGSAVAEVLGSSMPVPLERVGIPDVFAESGGYDQLLDRYGMSVEEIVGAARRAVSRKQKGHP